MNHYGSIRLFCEMNDLDLWWKKIGLVGLYYVIDSSTLPPLYPRMHMAQDKGRIRGRLLNWNAGRIRWRDQILAIGAGPGRWDRRSLQNSPNTARAYLIARDRRLSSSILAARNSRKHNEFPRRDKRTCLWVFYGEEIEELIKCLFFWLSIKYGFTREQLT